MDKNEFERMIREGQSKLPPDMRMSDADITNVMRIAESIEFVLNLVVKRAKPKNPLEDFIGRFSADKLIQDIFAKTEFVRDVKRSVWDEAQEPEAETLDEKPCAAVSTKPTLAHDPHGWWDPIERMAQDLPANCWCLGVTKAQAISAETRLRAAAVRDRADKIVADRLDTTAEGDAALRDTVLQGDKALLALSDTDAGYRHVVVTWARQNKISIVDDDVTCEVCWCKLSPTAHGMVEHRRWCNVK